MERILIIADFLDVVSPTGDAALLAKALIDSGNGVEIWQLSDTLVNDSIASATTNIHWPKRFCSRTVSTVRCQAKTFAPTQILCFGDNAITAGVVCNLRGTAKLVAVHAAADSLVDGHLSFRRRWQLAQFDQHFVGHSSVREALHFRFPSWNVDVLPRLRRKASGIDVQQIRSELGIPKSAKLVSTAGPLSNSFRMKDFIWACDLVTCIRDDVYWLLIGEGELRWRLQRFEGCLQIGEHLKYRDWSADSSDLIEASDIYVQTSAANQSACGLATAISLGTPCVVSKEVAHSELIQHGSSGYLVERSARNEFARCVNRLVNEPAIAARFSEAAAGISSREMCDAGQAARLLVQSADLLECWTG